MRKTIKIIFCSLVIVTILTANVFASGWAGYTPSTSLPEEDIFAESTTSVYSTTELINITNRAYALGLFGGAKPIAVLWFNGIIFFVSVSPIADINQTGTPTTKSEYYAYIDTETNFLYSSPDNSLLLSLLVSNGDFVHIESSESGVSLDLTKILLVLDENGNWYYDDNDNRFAQFHNVDANVNNTLVQIADTYESALAGYMPPSEPSVPSEPSEPSEPPIIQNYILDIPSIITAIPNGAKQIINNAFGFEIFGINIAGLLSVVLIVAIVAYAVKKMMSR